MLEMEGEHNAGSKGLAQLTSEMLPSDSLFTAVAALVVAKGAAPVDCLNPTPDGEAAPLPKASLGVGLDEGPAASTARGAAPLPNAWLSVRVDEGPATSTARGADPLPS